MFEMMASSLILSVLIQSITCADVDSIDLVQLIESCKYPQLGLQDTQGRLAWNNMWNQAIRSTMITHRMDEGTSLNQSHFHLLWRHTLLLRRLIMPYDCYIRLAQVLSFLDCRISSVGAELFREIYSFLLAQLPQICDDWKHGDIDCRYSVLMDIANGYLPVVLRHHFCQKNLNHINDLFQRNNRFTTSNFTFYCSAELNAFRNFFMAFVELHNLEKIDYFMQNKAYLYPVFSNDPPRILVPLLVLVDGEIIADPHVTRKKVLVRICAKILHCAVVQRESVNRTLFQSLLGTIRRFNFSGLSILTDELRSWSEASPGHKMYPCINSFMIRDMLNTWDVCWPDLQPNLRVLRQTIERQMEIWSLMHVDSSCLDLEYAVQSGWFIQIYNNDERGQIERWETAMREKFIFGEYMCQSTLLKIWTQSAEHNRMLMPLDLYGFLAKALQNQTESDAVTSWCVRVLKQLQSSCKWDQVDVYTTFLKIVTLHTEMFIGEDCLDLIWREMSRFERDLSEGDIHTVWVSFGTPFRAQLISNLLSNFVRRQDVDRIRSFLVSKHSRFLFLYPSNTKEHMHPIVCFCCIITEMYNQGSMDLVLLALQCCNHRFCVLWEQLDSGLKQIVDANVNNMLEVLRGHAQPMLYYQGMEEEVEDLVDHLFVFKLYRSWETAKTLLAMF